MAARKSASEAEQTLTGTAESLGKTDIMRRKLAAQEKVAIMIPLTPGEKEGATETVILNGYRVNIRKGTYVHVPKQVAQVIMESQQMTQAAIDNYFLMNSEGKSKAMKAKEINSDNE
jgi:hypothetical protein